MTERTGYTLAGNPLTLLGSELSKGDEAPDFKLLTTDLEARSLSDFEGAKLLVVVPSLDTGVCELETIRFNKEVENFDGLITLVISADLPFAQARFAMEKETDSVVFLSDHYDMNFANAYGTHIKELRLENRAIFVLNKNNVITHVEYLKENTEHPNYEAALEALRAL